jgi:hypothetical protein
MREIISIAIAGDRGIGTNSLWRIRVMTGPKVRRSAWAGLSGRKGPMPVKK